jgi:hypothetical protein
MRRSQPVDFAQRNRSQSALTGQMPFATSRQRLVCAPVITDGAATGTRKPARSASSAALHRVGFVNSVGRDLQAKSCFAGEDAQQTPDGLSRASAGVDRSCSGRVAESALTAIKPPSLDIA